MIICIFNFSTINIYCFQRKHFNFKKCTLNIILSLVSGHETQCLAVLGRNKAICFSEVSTAAEKPSKTHSFFNCLFSFLKLGYSHFYPSAASWPFPEHCFYDYVHVREQSERLWPILQFCKLCQFNFKITCRKK